jgi:isopentenyldiphosphate isomerase
MTEEYFNIVDERDQVIGLKSRREIHTRALRHRAAHILVFNSRGEVFLQKRSMKKDCCPGLWDTSAAGHLDAGEDYDGCAVRELGEELGLHLSAPPMRLFKVDARPDTGWEFVWVYRCEADGPFTLNPDEIQEGKWVSPARLDQWLLECPGELGGTLRLIWVELRECGLL